MQAWSPQGTPLGRLCKVVAMAGLWDTSPSAQGRGTEVQLLLPMEEAERMQAPPHETPEPDTDPAAGRILVVDDDAGVRKVIGAYLRRVGYQVLEAGDGAEALTRLDAARWEVDLVLTDISMPVLNGVELCLRVRAARPELPVICMSGFYSGEGLGSTEVPAGVLRLQKPIEFRVLRDAIRDALAKP